MEQGYQLYCQVTNYIVMLPTLLSGYKLQQYIIINYSTVTDLAKLRGLSTSVPRTSAAWYDNS